MNKQRLAAALNLIGILAERFPAAFAVNPRYRRPVKLGIREDLIAALAGAITPDEASLALAIYCGNRFYLRACTEGTPRIDLTGNAVGAVDADAANSARARLAQQQAKHERRQEAFAAIKAKAQAKARNAGRVSLADLRAAAQARRMRVDSRLVD